MTHVPRIHTFTLQSSIIGRVAIYCADVFSLFSTYASISSNLAPCISVSRGGFYHIPYNKLRGFLPVIYQATPCWNPPRARPIQGVITHLSPPQNSTACTTNLKKSLTPLDPPPPFPIFSTDVPRSSLPSTGYPPPPNNRHPKPS